MLRSGDPRKGRAIAFVLWHDGVDDGFDRCQLVVGDDGAMLVGEARLPRLGRGTILRYRLEAGADWHLVGLDVSLEGPAPAHLRLHARRPGQWWTSQGQHVRALDGCLDVTLEHSPVGITPAVRRLGLAPGTGAPTRAVHISVPGLAVTAETVGFHAQTPDRWQHHRCGQRRAVHIGAHGLVTEYEDGWTAVALG